MPEDTIELSNQLKARGLSCSKLDSKIKAEMADAIEFRKFGMETIAKEEEAHAERLKVLKSKICLLD